MPELTDQIQAIAHYPDGSPVCGVGHWRPDGGKPHPSAAPLIAYGRDERRAVMTAKKAFWHPKKGRPGCHDLEGEALEGATIRIGGEIVERYCKRVVTEAGKVTAVVFEWQDVREEEAEKKRAAEIAKAQAELDAAKPRRGKE